MCLDKNDAQGAWTCCRAFAKVSKGGNRNKGCAQIRPSIDDIKRKYQGPTRNGGWDATETSTDHINNLEVKTSWQPINITDRNVTEMYDKFSKEAKRSKNRKATPQGEIPSEV